MDDLWHEADEQVQRIRGAMPVGREASKQRGKKQTYRSKRKQRAVGKATSGIRHRRKKR